jgi:hypothetical protein
MDASFGGIDLLFFITARVVHLRVFILREVLGFRR